MIRRTDTQDGFTLVELLLALTFVSFILLFIVFAMLQVMGNYNKGLAIKEINQTSRTIVEEMSRVARFSSINTINTSATARGRICFGSVSYVWNTKGSSTNKLSNNAAVTLSRVEDAGGALCAAGNPPIPAAAATNLLTGPVWVQKLEVSKAATANLITIKLVLSTSDDNQPTDIDDASNPICSGNKAGNYCAVATFSTTVSTRGE